MLTLHLFLEDESASPTEFVTTSPTRTCNVKCGGPMDGYWTCRSPAVDPSGRCAKHTLYNRRFTLDELRTLPTGLGVHVILRDSVHQNYNLVRVDFDAGTAEVSHRSGYGRGDGKRNAPRKLLTIPVTDLIKPRMFRAWPVREDRQLGFIFNNTKEPA